MAGHFINNRLKAADMRMISMILFNNQANILSNMLSNVQHRNIKWNNQSEKELYKAMSGQPLSNRNQLPPHVYLEIQGQPSETINKYLMNADWVINLQRPEYIVRPVRNNVRKSTLGLREITQAAKDKWNRGNKHQALLEQLKNGGVSIEIYYLNGIRIR